MSGLASDSFTYTMFLKTIMFRCKRCMGVFNFKNSGEYGLMHRRLVDHFDTCKGEMK